MTFKTLDDLDFNGKRTLVRVDLNLPMSDGKVTDATRLERITPTIVQVLLRLADGYGPFEAVEALLIRRELLGEYLQGDLAVEFGVFRDPDFAHAAGG